MTTETRPRSTSDGDRDDQRYGGRNDRGYGAYTYGANALRLDSIFSDEDFEPPQWTTRVRPARGSAATRLTTVDRSGAGVPGGATSAPAPARRSGTPTRRVNAAPAAPRPGRSRKTPWLTDVTRETPVVAPASTSPKPAPALPLPRAPFVVLMIVLVVVGVVGVLVLNTKINEDSFRLADLRANQASLDLQEQQLRQQLADLESPNNLMAAATRLGLVPAGDPAFISLPDGRVVGLPQPASGR
jgi:hypothetical protein